MDPYLNDWLNLVLRWLHVVAGIAWIGASFYFIRLDLSLLSPKRDEDAKRGVGGEFWSVHGGGFYHTQKYRVAPETLPSPLHWFKWEAYTTWLSGFSLFVVLYYVNAETYLIDPQVADIRPLVAVSASIGLLAAAWMIYDLLCRLLGGRDWLLAVAIVALTVAAAYGVSHLYSGRAVYIQIGAMLGTIMAGNVFFNIIPAHWELVRAKKAGREPDPALGLQAKQRSVHNNYLTLPVVFTMISNHFPFTYGHDHGWLVLVALVVLGAWVRHFFNLRHAGRNAWWIPVTAAAAVVALAIAIRPDEGGGGGGPVAAVTAEEAQAIVQQRCVPCHSDEPTQEGFETAPGGVTFDTVEETESQAQAIKAQAVDSNAMPLGNVTGMTDEEREQLGAWIDSLE
ncbi:MAG TPA: urate hydroxylase PuuD [Gaiellaceae bacterium]|nr:urate hydroxylase PuuD [Gaiellaceae bacterium]